jgi:hypothetical protein
MAVCRHQFQYAGCENVQVVHVYVCDDEKSKEEQEKELAKNIVEVVDTDASVVRMWMKNRNSGGSCNEAAEVDRIL